MYTPLSVFIGLRYTRARRRERFISFMSLSSMIGLMLGVAVLITVLSVMNGFDRELRQRILGMVPHATLTATEPVANWQSLVREVESVVGVAAAAPMTQVQGMLTANGQVSGAMVAGIEPAREKRVSILPDYMESGTMDSLRDGEFGIVLGRQLASTLGVGIGDAVTLVLPEASLSAAGVIPRFKRFTVTGIFKVGAEVDGMLAYVHYADAGRLLRIGDRVQGVRIKVNDLFQARAVNEQVLSRLPPMFYGSDWSFTQGNLFNAIKMEKAMMALLLLLIVAVAAFNIVSSLVMVVNDKKSDIAILRTLGASPQSIMGVFMVQGAMVGIIGTGAGLLLGLGVAFNIDTLVPALERLLGASFLPQDIYLISRMPSDPQQTDILPVAVISLVLSFLATIYPSWRASRVNPAEALRYE